MNLKVGTVFLILIGFAPTVLAQEVTYPQVSSVAPTTVKPGDTITLSGKNFGREGQTYCWSPEKKLMTYQTVIGAYRQGTSPTSGMPNYRLPILSISDSTVVAQIPTDIVNGEYLVGYNAQYPKGVCQGYGDILVGFARYDPISVTGGKEATVVKFTPTSTPTPSITAETNMISQKQLPVKPSAFMEEAKSTSSSNKGNSPSFMKSVWNSLSSFFQSVRMFFNF